MYSNRKSHTVIKVFELSKMFKVYSKPLDIFFDLININIKYKPFWALKEISFEVKKGQIVGIIGKNGSGKSTLLRIISGVLDKTSGDIKLNGKISSILELGSGFNGEFTGRENIFMGGLMVGLKKEEIIEKQNWIIEFSELEAFIDQPFKTYSTGMQARLTFSTAVCVDPDILIVDEAISVGDIKFQSKCFSLMEKFRNAGKSILLVSHDLNAIKQFCNFAILLENGKIVKQGVPKEVADFYHKSIFSPKDKRIPVSNIELKNQSKILLEGIEKEPDSIFLVGESTISNEKEIMKEKVISKLHLNHLNSSGYGNHQAEFIDYGIIDEKGNRTTLLESRKNYYLFSRLLFFKDTDDIMLGIVIRNEKGVELFKMNSFKQQVIVPKQKKGNVLETKIKVTMWLASGDYFLTVGAVKHHGDPEDKIFDLRVDAVHFKVEDNGFFDAPTVVNLLPEWSLLSCVLLD